MRRISHLADLQNKDLTALPSFAPAVQSIVSTGIVEYQTPSNAFNLTANDSTNILVLDPAGALAAGTVKLPALPVGNQIFAIACTAAITLLTVSPNTGQTVKGVLTAIGSNGFASWIYRSANATWYRIG